jgi:arginine/lysine/ornithine decarboxylase
MLVYPPGIATVVPGERLAAQDSPMLGYLQMFEEAENRFPGFGTEIQGVYRETDAAGRITFYTYVARE